MDMTDTRIYEAADPAPRPALASILRGFGGRCPACGRGGLFRKFLKVADNCPDCGEELHHHQADDAPPYFTIMIVGHIVVPLLLIVEQTYQWSAEQHMIVWPLLTVLLALMALPFLKGGVLGLMWSMGITGRERQGAG